MIFSLLTIFGLQTALANDNAVYQINGSCENSYSKTIEGVFDLNCNSIKFVKNEHVVNVSIKDDTGMDIDLSIDNFNKKYYLERRLTKDRIDNVFNKCSISKEFIICDSYNNQEIVLHVEFKRK